uniref:ISXO2-like transposase domain-containing protein n=1 Tax=Plectus sambesii TaxID=2011161 RepID=A0A914VS85_9BILA
MAAADAVRELRNIRDIVNLFYEGPDAVFQFLTQHGLIMESMLCDKCLTLEGPIDCEVDAEMSLFRRNNELRWRCKARHERTIRHHSEFFIWEHDITANGRNNSNRLSLEQMLILTWSWCWDNNSESAAQNAGCSLKGALNFYSQCRRVCYAALDDREACPEAGLMGGPGHLVQIDECSVKARRKRAANGRGRLGPGDLQEPHRGTPEEQAALAEGTAADDDEEEEEMEDEEEDEEGGDDEPAGWVFGMVWWRSLEEKRQGVPQETRFFSVQKRDAKTLLNLIRNHVAPGTQIWSDCWRAYMRIDQLPEGYIHLTVNHSEFYTDDTTGVNTNAIEAAWNRLRHNICRTKRGVGKELSFHLAELWWKSLQRLPHPSRSGRSSRTFRNSCIFMNFLNLIRRVYAL